MDLERFEFIDRVEAVEAGGRAILCRTQLPVRARLYEGHFPGHALVPGTLQTEMMAQALGLLAIARHRLERMPFLLGIEHARFRHELPPGATVIVHAECHYDNGLMLAGRCRLEHDARVVSTAEIRLSLSAFASPALAAYARTLADRTGLLDRLASA